MKCHYASCTNVGIHSCNTCGGLFCGKHAEVKQDTYTGKITVICQDDKERKQRALEQSLREARAQRLEESAVRAAEESRAIGCGAILVGFGIAGIGMFLSYNGGIGWDVILILVGIVSAVLGGWYYYKNQGESKNIGGAAVLAGLGIAFFGAFLAYKEEIGWGIILGFVGIVSAVLGGWIIYNNLE